MPVIEKAWEELEQICGRKYSAVESYRSEDAKILLMTMGSFGETARVAIDEMRETGEEVGLVSLRLWRPFPFAQFKKAVGHAEILVVIDRAMIYGGPGGPVASEVRSALYSEKKRPKITNFIAGLAGRDVQPDDFYQMVERSKKKVKDGTEDEYEIYGVRA
jgi:pyruvate ferredoxin oxidoreductase alpha subunit